MLKKIIPPNFINIMIHQFNLFNLDRAYFFLQVKLYYPTRYLKIKIIFIKNQKNFDIFFYCTFWCRF